MWLSEISLRCAVLFLAAGLAACGFRLQGASEMPPGLSTVYIDTQDRYTEFYRGLRVALARGGAEVVESSVAAKAVIRITEDMSGQNVLTVDARNVPTEFDVFYTVRYSVDVDGIEVLPARTLSMRQDYTYDEKQVLGKQREEQELRESIASDLIRQVSLQLSRL